MRITVHSNVTEYESGDWKLFVGNGGQPDITPMIEDTGKCALLTADNNGGEFTFGDFSVAPIAGGILIEAKELRVVHYSGCNHNGEMPSGKIDYLVCEETAGLDALLDRLKPKAIIPVNTDNPRRFADLYCDKWPVILLGDGESFAAIRDPGFDTTTAMVMAFREPDDTVEIIDNPERLRWWMTDNKFLGEFQWWDDADFALRHVVYAPKRLLGYTIESDEDMAPWLYVVYGPDFTELAEYNEGQHEPGACSYAEPIPYAPGERALAIIDNLLLPCEIVGPLTVDFLREEFERYPFRGDNTFDEYLSELWDWDWDKVIVRPLLRLRNGREEIANTVAVNRIYLFPYKQ